MTTENDSHTPDLVTTEPDKSSVGWYEDTEMEEVYDTKWHQENTWWGNRRPAMPQDAMAMWLIGRQTTLIVLAYHLTVIEVCHNKNIQFNLLHLIRFYVVTSIAILRGTRTNDSIMALLSHDDTSTPRHTCSTTSHTLDNILRKLYNFHDGPPSSCQTSMWHSSTQYLSHSQTRQ